MSKFAIVNGKFITNDESQPFLDGTMLVKNKRIIKIAPEITPQELEGYQILDGRNRLYLPGLINTHCHSPMSLLRGYADDLDLHSWLNKIWKLEAKFQARDVKLGASLSIIEMIKSGTTCFLDMFFHTNQIAECVEKSGIRACLTQGVNDLGDAQKKFITAYTFAKEWHQKADGRIQALMSTHATFTCPPNLMLKIVEAAHELDLPITTHASETLMDIKLCQEMYQLSPIEYLEKYGMFSRPCLIAHAVHIDEDELNILAEHSVMISHNPGSNLKLASGIASVPKLLEKGLLISIGTDGPASSNNLDMLEVMRLTALLHKGNNHDPFAVNAQQAFQMATINGAKSLLQKDIGILQAGMKADFIAINIDQPHFYPLNNLLSHIVYSAAGHDVTDMWVDGKQIMKNREVLTLDEEKIKHEFQKAYQVLLNSA